MKNSKFKIKNGYDKLTTIGHPEGTPEGSIKSDLSLHIFNRSQQPTNF